VLSNVVSKSFPKTLVTNISRRIEKEEGKENPINDLMQVPWTKNDGKVFFL
jgi:hypothetical protein